MSATGDKGDRAVDVLPFRIGQRLNSDFSMESAAAWNMNRAPVRAERTERSAIGRRFEGGTARAHLRLLP